MRLRKLQSASRQICDAFGIAKKHYPEIKIDNGLKEYGTIEEIITDSSGAKGAIINLNRRMCRKNSMPILRVLVHEIVHQWLFLHEIKISGDAAEDVCEFVESLLSEYDWKL